MPPSEYIIPAKQNLDSAPGGDDGQIIEVEMDTIDERRRRAEVQHKACQACGDAAHLLEPHVAARGWRMNAIGKNRFRVVFCDRECWAEWASADD